MNLSWAEFTCHNKATNYALQAQSSWFSPLWPCEAVRISATQKPNYLYLYKANPVRCTLPGLFVPAVPRPRQCFYLAEVAFYGQLSNPLHLGPSPRDLRLGCVFGLPNASKWKLALKMDPPIQEGIITETWDFEFVDVLSSFCLHWNAPIAVLKVEVVGHLSNWLVHFPMCQWSVLLILVTVLWSCALIIQIEAWSKKMQRKPVLNKIAHHQTVHVMNSNRKKHASSLLTFHMLNRY